MPLAASYSIVRYPTSKNEITNVSLLNNVYTELPIPLVS